MAYVTTYTTVTPRKSQYKPQLYTRRSACDFFSSVVTSLPYFLFHIYFYTDKKARCLFFNNQSGYVMSDGEKRPDSCFVLN